MNKVKTLLRTLSHLKPLQAVFQVRNRFLPKKPLKAYSLKVEKTLSLSFFKAKPISEFLQVDRNTYKFTFLNLEKNYSQEIDWNDQSHGKLWNYNLQYLDFLKQDSIKLTIKITLVKDLYAELWNGSLPLEPYPVSLRIMNMIRFLESNAIDASEKSILYQYVMAELHYLRKNLEYHLLGNHLLENAFALWMGVQYFQIDTWRPKAQKLLAAQLQEQILPDGAHYELAPMYHQIILFRVLEAYHLTPVEYALNQTLKHCSERMLTWTYTMTLPDGSLPHFNDTTNGIAYKPSQLKTIAEAMELFPADSFNLKESGYRRLKTGNLTLIADLEGIKPSYQPGHAHADTFSFVLHDGINPIIVDPGISTYTISERRDWERSTQAHNTISVNGQNSSEVWAGFRVGRRAQVKLLQDNSVNFSAEHNGFGSIKHRRTFLKLSEGIKILDLLESPANDGLAFLHFHPDVIIHEIEQGKFLLNNNLRLDLIGAKHINIEPYKMAVGYHHLVPSKRLVIQIKKDQLETKIYQHS